MADEIGHLATIRRHRRALEAYERVRAVLDGRLPDRVPFFDNYWPQFRTRYLAERGLPPDTDLRTHFDHDLVLKRLNLRQTAVSGPGLEHLNGLRALEELDLAGMTARDAGSAHLKGLTGLKRLDLIRAQVPGRDVQPWGITSRGRAILYSEANGLHCPRHIDSSRVAAYNSRSQ